MLRLTLTLKEKKQKTKQSHRTLEKEKKVRDEKALTGGRWGSRVPREMTTPLRRSMARNGLHGSLSPEGEWRSCEVVQSSLLTAEGHVTK